MLRFFSILGLQIILAQMAFAAEIRGQVFLENKNGKSPLAHTSVRLHVYRDDYEFSGAETKTDGLGRYKFQNLDQGERFAYIVYPIYQDVNYPYEEVVFDDSTAEQRNFVLQETTGSTKDITVDEAIFFDQGKKDIWKITHEITLTNNGEFLYHPSREDTEPLVFSLFNGGFDLAYMEGITRENSDIDDKEDVLSLSLTLAPKDPVKIKFSYFYIPEKRSIDFNRSALLNRSNVSLFFHKNIRLKSKKFQRDPMQAAMQKDYAFAYTSGPIAKDEPIQFSIRGFFMQRDILHIALFLCMMLFALLLGLSIRKMKTFKKENSKVLTERMHQYLIDLKKRLQDGQITEKEFAKENDRVLNFLFQLERK